MKKILIVAFSASVLFACSSDDNDNGPGSGVVYLPLTAGNYWTYDVEGSTVSGRDSLYVANDTVIGGDTYKKMKTQFLAFGFYSGALNNNGVRNSNGSVVVTGNAGLNLGEAFPIEIALSNFTLLKDNASDGQQLGSVSGSIEQTFQTYPLTLDYTLKSTAQTSLPTYTANGNTYTDVKVVQVRMNLKISSTTDVFGFPVTIPILAPQDVVISTMYFAKDIGMVHSTTQISYNLEDFSGAGFDLPIPASGNEVQQEFLDSYIAD